VKGKVGDCGYILGSKVVKKMNRDRVVIAGTFVGGNRVVKKIRDRFVIELEDELRLSIHLLIHEHFSSDL
jgi:hypothetical protein